jgi:hypothetical protein
MPEWLDVHLKNNVVSETTKPFYANLLKPVNTTKIENWKTGMNIYDQTITEIITGDFAKKFYQYDIDSNKTNKPIKISFFTLLRGKIIYYAWQKFKQLKAKSFRFNLFYGRLRVKLNPNPNARISKYF